MWRSMRPWCLFGKGRYSPHWSAVAILIGGLGPFVSPYAWADQVFDTAVQHRIVSTILANSERLQRECESGCDLDISGPGSPKLEFKPLRLGDFVSFQVIDRANCGGSGGCFFAIFSLNDGQWKKIFEWQGQLAILPTKTQGHFDLVAGRSNTTFTWNGKQYATNADELDRTLQRLRALSRQSRPPTARVNPVQDGAPQVAADTKGDVIKNLTAAQRGAIGERVRECWISDAGRHSEQSNTDNMQVSVTVTLDPLDGSALEVVPAELDRTRVASNPRLREFFERAQGAILNPRCGHNLVPKEALVQNGTSNRLTFRLSP